METIDVVWDTEVEEILCFVEKVLVVVAEWFVSVFAGTVVVDASFYNITNSHKCNNHNKTTETNIKMYRCLWEYSKDC